MKWTWVQVWALGLAALLLPAVMGCRTGTGNAATGAAVALAACEATRQDARTAPWLELAGEVFITFGASEPPTPEALGAALRAVTARAWTTIETDAIWALTLVVYEEIYRPDMTLEQAARVRTTLGVIGTALQRGARCAAPPTGAQAQQAARTGPVPWQTGVAVGEAVAAELRRGWQ